VDKVDCHMHSPLDHVYTEGFVAESVVLEDSTTDHRPMVTTVKAGGSRSKGGETSLLQETKLQCLDADQPRERFKPPRLVQGL
jgi:hypothetical protein